MNASAIRTATIEVKYANPPLAGKKQATIKTPDGTIFGVWPKDLGRFQPGRRYAVEYTEKPFKGRMYRTILKAEPQVNGEDAAPAGSDPVRTSGEVEFITALLAARVASCGVEFTPSGLTEAARMLRMVYRSAFGTVA